MPAEERVQDDTVIVIAGGGPPHARAARELPAGARVVAADQGLDHALELGLRVDVAVGDFDSATAAGLAAAERAGVRIERHPPEKDATDLELALDAAAELGPQRIVVLGPGAGRLDHLLAAVLELGSKRYARFEIDALLGPATVHVVHGERRLHGQPGELVSLLPVHGAAYGVVTDGLAYPLRAETLPSGSSRGISNVFATSEARVSLERGVLLVIRPGTETEEHT
jgi:thiamine pyrophosphokinase